ncbi:MAG: hypothetical protein RL033_576 [Pseudomonadota bacterium]|jgi:hypothetical protein
MTDEAPVRKHVNISARDSAQLELRLHWFASALAERQGYIVALLRRCNASGHQVATVSYELQLPRVAPPAQQAHRSRSALRPGVSAGSRPQAASSRHRVGERALQQPEATSSSSL